MFSMMPHAASCRPRWATGRAVNQSGARTDDALSQGLFRSD
jgi:hypothetical protein